MERKAGRKKINDSLNYPNQNKTNSMSVFYRRLKN